MYWPVGTPRVYATSSSQTATFNLQVSHDGLSLPISDDAADKADSASLLTADSASSHELLPSTPITPMMPQTPGIKSVEHDLLDSPSEDSIIKGPVATKIPLKEPILSLRVPRTGHLFAVITATSMTIWQAKVRSWTKASTLACIQLT